MHSYKVTGIDTESGEPRTRMMRADSIDDATRRAGFAVSDVKRMPEPAPAGKRGGKAPGPASLERNFYGLATAAMALTIFAGVSIALAVLFIAMAVAADGGLAAVGAAVGCIMWAIFTYATAEALTALRVIAINSFK